MANFHGEKSFLRRAGVMDVFLDVNNLPRIGKTIYDEDFEITPEFDGRPDILAYKLYGAVQYWYVFALRNPDLLVDPIRDFKAGVTIKLPSAEAVKLITGGN